MATYATNPVTEETALATDHIESMLSAYSKWRQLIRTGEVHHMMYSDMFNFVNERVETVQSGLLLLQHRKAADALSLSRSLLENYLLFMLMCRGKRYFQLQNLSNLSEGQVNERLADQQEKLRREQEAGLTKCLAVEKYPRRKKYLMYVFEGLSSKEEPDFFIPLHFFQFQDFVPETMRLKDEDYFQWHEPPADLMEHIKTHRNDVTERYRTYLSYEGLLQCLNINQMADNGQTARIEAHYTFLGRFVHPTHEATRALRNRSLTYDGRPTLNLSDDYTDTALLLGTLYIAFLTAGLFAEIANLITSAPSKYISSPGTKDLMEATARTDQLFPYFWFIYNLPPLYDRFLYCTTHATAEELQRWGGYANVPSALVPFSQDIYGHLVNSLGNASSGRAGAYRSPIPRVRP